ncbi:hypothetical protein [Arthrobacter sp. H35-D1]|uniref:hypothetical protein n=1 Tax=Arthrobacter sp. H35-D1 TaxID=3046202 RepID=UPI0024BBCE02|nr:hypothetical protein [Arthrobacter sp. H35-D1]MDJ0315061.1 hypothetical protein [Arthrobacter sp. H35-D1]
MTPEELILDDMAMLYPGHVVSVLYINMNRYEATLTGISHTYLVTHDKAVRQN